MYVEKKFAGKFNYAKKIYLDNILFRSLAIRSFDIGSRFAMKLVVRFREVKIQSKRHTSSEAGTATNTRWGLTGRLSKARDQRDSNLAPFSALTITNFSKEKCFFLSFTIKNEKDLGK